MKKVSSKYDISENSVILREEGQTHLLALLATMRTESGKRRFKQTLAGRIVCIKNVEA